MTERKRILMLYADAGFGHRSAALAIEEALCELYGERVQVDLVNPFEDPRTPTLLRDSQSDYDKMVRSMPEVYKLGYQASDSAIPTTLVESALIVMLYEVMRDVVRKYRPDAIVSTYPLYQAPLDAVFTISRRYVPTLVVVTDLATVHRVWFNSRVEAALVPNARVRELALDAGLNPDQVQITGIPVHPRLTREKRSVQEIRSELGWRQDIFTVLAVGSKRAERLPEILHVLNHSGLPLQIAAVAGGDENLLAELQAQNWHGPAHVYPFVENMPALLRASDVLLCKAGGLIVTEALACGLPMILTSILPGQEEGNAAYVVEGGAAELGQSPVEVLETVFHWLQNGGELLRRRAQNARNLGRPDAAYAAADLAFAAALRGPLDKTGRHIFGRPKVLDLLRTNHVRLKERAEAE